MKNYLNIAVEAFMKDHNINVNESFRVFEKDGMFVGNGHFIKVIDNYHLLINGLPEDHHLLSLLQGRFFAETFPKKD